MNRATRALAALLSYPTPALRQALPEIRAALAAGPRTAPAVRAGLLGLCDHLAADDILDRQEEYVALFDRSRAVSLHLFEHVHGDSRERGPAMVELKEIYAAAGLDPDPQELPDYLPMMLEYAAVEEAKGAELLANAAPVIDIIHARLVRRGSPYAAALRAALAVAGSQPSAESPVAEPEETAEALDAAYEEAPVTFGQGADPAAEAANGCGPVGIAAKLRAARRAASVTPRRPDIRRVAVRS
jgi:nitrate reductase delta subunit